MGKTSETPSRRTLPFGLVLQCVFALLLYAFFSIYLFRPYMSRFSTAHSLYDVLNPAAAALGAYFLSKRWVYHWTPSLFAGAAYGFGPFGLGFTAFHPLAGLSWMMVPWLLLPAVYWRRGKEPDMVRLCGRAMFSLLPFAWIILVFWISAKPWFGPVSILPQNTALTLRDFMGLIFPLHEAGKHLIFGLYHASLAMALMGVFVFAKLQRIALLIPIAVGLMLAFWEPVFQVSPAVWAAFPILFLSVLCGLGFETLMTAGKPDSKWIAVCAGFATGLAAFFGGLSIRIILVSPEVFKLTALMYGAAAAALWFLFFFARAGLRWPWMRWVFLTAAAGIDLFFSACYFVAKLF
ncbi:MAG: hypothetical protein L0Y36_02330 [Planctomycetales bacterium]|nr:hypothetical protein [Planctomycetales bacterium]